MGLTNHAPQGALVLWDHRGVLRFAHTDLRTQRGRLTLALSGGAAVVSTKTAVNTIDEHQGEPASGLVRFNAWLDRHGLAEDPDADAQAAARRHSVPAAADN